MNRTLLLAVVLLLVTAFVPALAILWTRVSEWRRFRKERGDVGARIGYARDEWLAVRTGARVELAAALELGRLRSIGWPAGLARAREWGTAVFVSPVVDGWTLVVGALVTDSALAQLSRALKCEVQLFAVGELNRHATWARACDGELLRSVEVNGGEVVHQVGEPSADERSLMVWVPPSEDEPLRVELSGDTVAKLAAAWSVDPLGLHNRVGCAGGGSYSGC